MKTSEALKITGSLSKPSKMPGWAYGLPAKECKTGAKLAKVPGSVCYDCYALKGCYVFKVVQAAQYKDNFKGIYRRYESYRCIKDYRKLEQAIEDAWLGLRASS